MSRSSGVVVVRPRVEADGSSLSPYGPALDHLRYAGYALAGRASAWQRHSHGILELHYLVQGSFRLWMGSELMDLSGGHVLLVPPGVVHGGWLGRMPPGELYWLCLRAPQRSDDFLGLSNEETGLLREALFEHSGRTFRVTKNLAVPFRALVDAYPVRDAAALLSARAALLQILEIVAEASRSPKGRRVSPRIERAVALMAEHLESPWHVTALAREVGYSPTHFAREFRARMGTSAKDYYARCRILAACRELMAAHASVTSLAHKLGFASSQHFATAFKRVTGLTPTEYHAACTARSSDESFPA